MSLILAIDPGPTESAVIALGGTTVYYHAKLPNAAVLAELGRDAWGAQVLAVEMIASYGMSVGAEVFQTCVVIGRMVQEWDRDGAPPSILVPRLTAKLHVCKSAKAKDSNVRQGLLDLWGGDSVALAKRTKCGTCKGKGYTRRPDGSCMMCHGSGKVGTDGPLVGLSGDEWAALAVAVTVRDGGHL